MEVGHRMSRPLVMIEWQGKLRPRREVMVELHQAGMPKAEIARRLGVIYQQVQIVVGPTGSQPASPGRRAPDLRPRVRPEIAHARDDVDAVLLGCVKTKDVVPRAAKDLYVSPLFRGRRRHAEASGKPWWIVSAEHGLVGPDEIIAPYDTLIGQRPRVERERIANQVADRLDAELGTVRGKRLELHAGIEYAEAIGPELRRRGAELVRPLEGLSFGQQLAWYAVERGADENDAYTARPPSERTARAQAPIVIGDGRGLSRRITELFVSGDLDLSGRAGAPASGWDGMPEVIAASTLRAAGADDVTVRRFLTFCAAMDRARDADRLAQAAVRLHAVHAWAFDPTEVARRSLRELTAALRTFRVSQRHSADAYAWRVIAETLADGLAPVATGAIEGGVADAADLLAELVAVGPDGGPLFPLLGGPKIGPLWVRLLAYPGGATISHLEVVPVAVDVQVRKVTEYLGITSTVGAELDDVRSSIQETWRRDVELHGSAGPSGLENTSGALDPALWFYGKWGCTFCERARRQLPISSVCSDCRFPIEELGS